MKIITTTTTTITFSVACYTGSKGGMNVTYFGEEVFTIEEALEVYQRAKISDRLAPWVIVGVVETSTDKK